MYFQRDTVRNFLHGTILRRLVLNLIEISFVIEYIFRINITEFIKIKKYKVFYFILFKWKILNHIL
jgi:hypothetical protein